MKISMTRTIQGSLDGATVGELLEGMVYDTIPGPRGERLAQSHIRKGDAALVEGEVAPQLAPLVADAPLVSAATSPSKLKAPRRARAK